MDTEIGLYYLVTRYYDSVTYRFINADGYFQTGQGFLDKNMGAYCLNNPVMRFDPTGTCSSFLCAGRGVCKDFLSFPKYNYSNPLNLNFNSQKSPIGFESNLLYSQSKKSPSSGYNNFSPINYYSQSTSSITLSSSGSSGSRGTFYHNFSLGSSTVTAVGFKTDYININAGYNNVTISCVLFDNNGEKSGISLINSDGKVKFSWDISKTKNNVTMRESQIFEINQNLTSIYAMAFYFAPAIATPLLGSLFESGAYNGAPAWS